MLKQFLRLVRQYLPPYRGYLIWNLLLNVLAQILNVFSFALIIPILQTLFKVSNQVYSFVPWDSTNIIDAAKNNFYWYMNTLIEQRGALWVLIMSGLLLIIMTFLKTACYFGSSATLIPLRTGVVRDMRQQVYDKVLLLPLGFFNEERKGDIISRMSSDISGLETCFSNSLDMLIKNPIAIIVTLLTLFAVDWKLTLFVLIVSPLIAWVMGVISRKLKRKSKETQTYWGQLLAQLDETLGGLRIIKAFLAEKKMSKRFSDVNNSYRNSMVHMSVRQASAHPVSEFMGTALIVIVLWAGGFIILGNKSTMDASLFIYYLIMLYNIINPIKDLSKAYYNIPVGLGCWERVEKILSAENTIREAEHPVPVTSFNEGIVFQHVDFSYTEGRPVLKDINIRLPKGKTIALVGQSGSGKSTLVDLLPRFHDVCGGSITIDGTDIRNVSLHDLRALIGNVNQEAILFNDTFYNNITFGVEGATREQVIEAAKTANAHDFIMETPDGYDTVIGDRGCLLSGGQRQRISIARAILKNPPILILDEATSALDTESERLVQEALEHLMTSRTTIAIAHRLSTIRHADEICVMFEGEIVERGTHDELLALGGYYKRLQTMQAL
ncbi:MAG: ABC transporter ATP-binding protein [Bacteroidaceae bacterium]|nr:ABC transporter ATP-binding protein [Bacteroidaceae bacterium]